MRTLQGKILCDICNCNLSTTDFVEWRITLRVEKIHDASKSTQGNPSHGVEFAFCTKEHLREFVEEMFDNVTFGNI